jgi:3-hydroxymyristoyl/3-hydroxydecanoyl-(acyl carrier protein) dehydratase
MNGRIQLPVADDHPAFRGHFPGRPIVPGALLIDLALLAVEQATGSQVASIAQTKFLSPAAPGDILTLLFESGEHGVRFEIEGVTEGVTRKLASGRFTMHAAAA